MPKVIYEPGAWEQYVDLPLPIQARVVAMLDRLESWPDVSGAKPLRGSLVGKYRLRTGDFRIQFRVTGDMVLVEKIGHRDSFYEE